MATLERLIAKVHDALIIESTDGMSLGEALAVALVLNRSDWLAAKGYSIAEALERIGEDWVRCIPQVERIFGTTREVLERAQSAAQDEAILSGLGEPGREVDVSAKLVTYGHAPGYRDVSLTFDVQRSGSAKTHRLCLQLDREDSDSVLQHILQVHRSALANRMPIDLQEGEQRPIWVDSLPPPR